MFRRDFLKSLAAVAAGMAAAARSGELVASSTAPPARKPINVTLGANTDGLRSDLCDAQRRVLELIKECSVVAFSRSIAYGELPRYQVVYEYREGMAPQRTPFTDDADRLAAVGNPLSIQVTTTADMVDVTRIGEFRKFEREQVAHRVEIEWITMTEDFV